VREADRSPPSSAEVKNCEAVFPLSLYVFMGWTRTPLSQQKD
jgi:hypothetical protein